MITIEQIEDRTIFPVHILPNVPYRNGNGEECDGRVEFFIDDDALVAYYRTRTSMEKKRGRMERIEWGNEQETFLAAPEGAVEEFFNCVARLYNAPEFVHVVFRRFEYEDRTVEGVYRSCALALRKAEQLKKRISYNGEEVFVCTHEVDGETGEWKDDC